MPSPTEPARSEAYGEEVCVLGRGEAAFHPAAPSAFHSRPLVPGSVMALENPSGTAGVWKGGWKEGSGERMGRERG